jgi:hypothetical protein
MQMNSGERTIQVSGMLAAVGLIIWLVLMQQRVMSTSLLVAFWSMVAAVVMAEVIAHHRLKGRMRENRGVEVVLELVFATIVAVLGYLFASRVYPGTR